MHREQATTGDVIDGRYRIDAHLGKGGFARVFRATDLETGAPIALKLLRGAMLDDTTPLVRFMKEGNILARLGAHPNVIQVLDAGLTDDEDPFIAMELLEGETLTTFIKEQAPVSWDEALGFMSQVAEGLEHAHAAGIIHRDLKPGNILLTADSHGVLVPKLVDFGIAKVLEAAMDLSVTRVGTPAYCAPEQLGRGLRRASSKVGITVTRGLSPATDVWPFGLITYELLTGLDVTQYWGAPDLTNILMKSALEPREKPSKVAGDQRIYLPPEFDAWFMCCLEPNSTERYQTPTAAVEALADLLDLTVDDVPTLGPESPQLRAAERELLAALRARTDSEPPAPTVPRPKRTARQLVSGAAAIESPASGASDEESTAEIAPPPEARDREPSLPGITLDDRAAAEAPPVPTAAYELEGPSSEDDEALDAGAEKLSEELTWGVPGADDALGGADPFSDEVLARLALDEESETPPSLPPSAQPQADVDDEDSDGATQVMLAQAPGRTRGAEPAGGAVTGPELPSDWGEVESSESSADDRPSGEAHREVEPPTRRMADEVEPPTRRMAEDVEPPTRRLPPQSRHQSSLVPYAIGAVLIGAIAAVVWDRALVQREPTQAADAGSPQESPAVTVGPPATEAPTAAPPLPIPTPSSTPTVEPSATPELDTEPEPDAGLEAEPVGSAASATPAESAAPSATPPPPPRPPYRPRWPRPKYTPPGI